MKKEILWDLYSFKIRNDDRNSFRRLPKHEMHFSSVVICCKPYSQQGQHLACRHKEDHRVQLKGLKTS